MIQVGISQPLCGVVSVSEALVVSQIRGFHFTDSPKLSVNPWFGTEEVARGHLGERHDGQATTDNVHEYTSPFEPLEPSICSLGI